MSARKCGLAAVFLLGPLAAGGCQLATYLAAVMMPPQKVKAVYAPPRGKTYLVFVDDRPAPVAWEGIKSELATRIGRRLREEKLASSVVPYERLQDLAATRGFDRLAVSEVGQKLGADVVLYVQIERFALRDNPYSPWWQGQLATSVWLVDARQPRRLWPTNVPSGAGYDKIPPAETKPVENPSPTYGEEVARKLAEQMADRIVKLFYDHTEEADPHHDEGSLRVSE